jgi:hypothetical protein
MLLSRQGVLYAPFPVRNTQPVPASFYFPVFFRGHYIICLMPGNGTPGTSCLVRKTHPIAASLFFRVLPWIPWPLYFGVQIHLSRLTLPVACGTLATVILIAVRAVEIALAQQVEHDFLRRLHRALAGGVDPDLGMRGHIVGIADTGKFRDYALARLGI